MSLNLTGKHCVYCGCAHAKHHYASCLLMANLAPHEQQEAYEGEVAMADLTAGKAEDTVLDEARRLIYGDRQDQYGNARENFTRIAELWKPILGQQVGPEAVALCLLQLKVARAIGDLKAQRPVKRDTVIDLAGYAGCIEKIQKGL